MSLFAETQRPSAWPSEVLDRLLRYDLERRERLAQYEAAWERKWREARGTAQPRAMWMVKR